MSRRDVRAAVTVGGKQMSPIAHHTTRAHPAYEPRPSGVRLPWALVIARLALVAFAGVLLRPALPTRRGRSLGIGRRGPPRAARQSLAPLRAVDPVCLFGVSLRNRL